MTRKFALVLAAAATLGVTLVNAPARAYTISAGTNGSGLACFKDCIRQDGVQYCGARFCPNLHVLPSGQKKHVPAKTSHTISG